jgi:hypothetical protein
MYSKSGLPLGDRPDCADIRDPLSESVAALCGTFPDVEVPLHEAKSGRKSKTARSERFT